MTDSTDPGAVTRSGPIVELVDIARAVYECAVAHEPGVRLIGNVRACEIAHLAQQTVLLKRARDQCESALTAMTARAEAAEALIARVGQVVASTVDCDKAIAYLWRLLGEPAGKPLPSTRLYGGKVIPVARPHGIDLATYLMAEAEREGGAGDPPPEPAPAGFAREQRVVIKKPHKPLATTGVVFSVIEERRRAQVRVDYDHSYRYFDYDDLEPEPAPQPAAAPKVLPVEALDKAVQRLERFRTFGNTADLTMAVANVIEYLRLTDRLERGGEGKGG